MGWWVDGGEDSLSNQGNLAKETDSTARFSE